MPGTHCKSNRKMLYGDIEFHHSQTTPAVSINFSDFLSTNLIIKDKKFFNFPHLQNV
jgi:hypothetical protein